jgi:hypothetical protein
LISFPGF